MTQIHKEYVSANEITKIVKVALAERYGRKNVSVQKGRGTASGWVSATIEIQRPKGCYCLEGMPYCMRCREELNLAAKEARDRVYAAMDFADAEFSTFYSDDGVGNIPRDCFNLHVHLKNKHDSD